MSNDRIIERDDGEDILVVAMRKDNGDKYALFFRAHDRAGALCAVSRWAQDETLSFSWSDATKMSREVFERT